MMVKKPKTVQPATDTPKSEPVAEAEAPAEVPSTAVVPEAVSPIQIPPKVLEQAKALGIDLGQIVDWAKGMEEFKAVTLKNFEIIQASFNELQPLVQLSKQVQQAQSQPQQQQQTLQGRDMGAQILALLNTPLAQQLMGSGGGDSEFAELGKKALLSQISMSNAIANAVVAKITGKATSDVAAAVTGS